MIDLGDFNATGIMDISISDGARLLELKPFLLLSSREPAQRAGSESAGCLIRNSKPALEECRSPGPD